MPARVRRSPAPKPPAPRRLLDASDCIVRRSMHGPAATCAAPRAVWDAMLDEYPRDLIALKVSQFVLSYLGESEGMRERVARVLPVVERRIMTGLWLRARLPRVCTRGIGRLSSGRRRRPSRRGVRPRRHLGSARRCARCRDGRSACRTGSTGSRRSRTSGTTARTSRCTSSGTRACITSSSSSTIVCSRCTIARCGPSRRTSISTSRTQCRCCGASSRPMSTSARVGVSSRRARRPHSTITHSCSSTCTISWRWPRRTTRVPFVSS